MFVGERAAHTKKPSSRRSAAGSNANTSRIAIDDPDQSSDSGEADR